MRNITLWEVRPYNGMVYKLAVPEPPRDAHEENVARTGAVSHVQDVLMALCARGDVVVDVGVNIGTVAVPLALKGISVVGYDLSADNLAITAASAEANGLSHLVKLRHGAVWNEPGTVAIGGNNSLMIVSENYETLVPSVTLSSEFSISDRIAAIKVDVEGAEIKVFEGARPHLEAYHPHLIFEVYPMGMASYGTSVGELMRYLEGIGYSLYRLSQYGLVPGYNPPAEQLVTDYLATILPPDVLARKTGLSIGSLSTEQIIAELELQNLMPVGHRRYALAIQDTLPPAVLRTEKVKALLAAWDAELGRDPEVSELRRAVYG